MITGGTLKLISTSLKMKTSRCSQRTNRLFVSFTGNFLHRGTTASVLQSCAYHEVDLQWLASYHHRPPCQRWSCLLAMKANRLQSSRVCTSTSHTFAPSPSTRTPISLHKKHSLSPTSHWDPQIRSDDLMPCWVLPLLHCAGPRPQHHHCPPKGTGCSMLACA